MARTTTTLAAAVSVSDNSVVVTSATGFAAGYLLRVDGEEMQVAQTYASGTTIPVLRGREGSPTAAHVSGANITAELASDPAATAPQTAVQWPNTRARTTISYSAAGAIAVNTPGSDQVAIINGTTARAMTLANPTKDQDGDMLWICSNGKAAHTVTYSAGIGNAGAGYTVATYTTGAQQTLFLIANNGIWQQGGSHFSGTLTAILIALA